MTKEELIQLLKEHRETVAKLKLRRKEKSYYEKMLRRKVKIETTISASNNINSDIQSKNKISDKVGNTVSESLDKEVTNKQKAKEEIKKLEIIINELENKVKEVDIRLNSLYYKEREILTAYYVDHRTAEDICQNLYFKLFSRTCSPRYIREVIKKNTEKILNL